MSSVRAAALAVLMSAAVAAPLAAKPACYTPEEVRAAQLRQLHTEMMVAALKCGDPELRSKYNEYVRRFGSPLNQNAKVLQSHFARHYGKDQTRQFDRYITQLANDASIRAQSTADYCGIQEPLFDKVLALKPAELEGFATGQVGKPHAATACTQQAEARPAAEAKRKPTAKAATRKPQEG